MPTTILPKKSTIEQPVAINDDVQKELENDYAMNQSPFINPDRFIEVARSYTDTTQLNKAGDNAAQNAEVLVLNDNSDWINKKWRPLMAFIYMITCTVDFILFPILWSILQAMDQGNVTQQWQPLTLQGAGLYHVAMGAVLGIAAYGRTKEKLEGKT